MKIAKNKKIKNIGTDKNINLNLKFSFKKINIIKDIIKLNKIPSFFVQIIKFKKRRIIIKLNLLLLFSKIKLKRYFDKIKRKEKTRISWVPLKSQ